jgi:hypothetical protein
MRSISISTMQVDMEAALEVFLEADPGTRKVAVIGDKTRTRYTDQEMVFIILDIFRTAGIFNPIHSGKLPFDMYLEEVCGHMGLLDYMIGPEERAARLEPYARSPRVLDEACLMINFPPQGEEDAANRRLARDTDPELYVAALKRGIPVLSVWRDGTAELEF